MFCNALLVISSSLLRLPFSYCHLLLFHSPLSLIHLSSPLLSNRPVVPLSYLHETVQDFNAILSTEQMHGLHIGQVRPVPHSKIFVGIRTAGHELVDGKVRHSVLKQKDYYYLLRTQKADFFWNEVSKDHALTWKDDNMKRHEVHTCTPLVCSFSVLLLSLIVSLCNRLCIIAWPN